MPTISAIAGKLGIFKKGSTTYQLSKWSFEITLDTGDVLHFGGQTDGNSNYWPTVVKNWAKGEGSAEGKVDDATNIVSIDANNLYVGVTGTFGCMWHATNGMTFPAVITAIGAGQDAGGQEGGDVSLKFKMTGPPTRVTS